MAAATAPAETSTAKREALVRSTMDSLSYLPTTASVAVKLIELGRSIDTDPAEYSEVIGADPALSAKLLALANSPWYGLRNKVSSVKLAVNLLGLGTVRTLALSCCMAGLHNELHLSREDARMYWEAALSRAVAAREACRRLGEKTAEEAFVGGLFQDFALPVLHSVDREALLGLLQDPRLNWEARLKAERELFGTDHAELGRVLAQKLELPGPLVDSIAFHHEPMRLQQLLESPLAAKGIHAASLFPSLLDTWSEHDASELCDVMAAGWGLDAEGVTSFLGLVQTEFNKLIRYFDEDNSSQGRLAELMIVAARESADNTSQLVRTVSQMMQEAANVGKEMSKLIQQTNQLEDKAIRDPLTGLLNRDGFTTQAQELICLATRYKTSCALVYLDVDKFKTINDTMGHEWGDRALKQVAEKMAGVVRHKDVLGRLGGDEFVMALYDCREADATVIVERVLSEIAREPLVRGQQQMPLSLSAGLLVVEASDQPWSLDMMMSLADRLMYKSKQAGGNQLKAKSL